MINSSQKTKQIRRTQLWYGQYNQCLKFKLVEAQCLRTLDHAQVDRIVSVRRAWGKKIAHQPNYGGSWVGRWQNLVITDQNVEDLHDFCDFLLAHQQDSNTMISGDWVYFYCNDPEVVSEILEKPYINTEHCESIHLVLKGQPNSVCLKNPGHRLRSYMKSHHLNQQQSTSLKKFILQQQEIRPSPSLLHWAQEKDWMRVFEYYFLDHNDESMLLMLSLISPGLIRKTLPIVADK